MTPFAKGDADVFLRSNEPENFLGRSMGLPSARGIGPEITESFSRQQSSGRDQGFEVMLVEGEFVFSANEFLQFRTKPIRDGFDEIGECLRFGPL